MIKETDKTKEINGTKYTVLRMPAIIGTKLFFKIVKFASPMLKGVDTKNQNQEKMGLEMISEILTNIDPEESTKLLTEILTNEYVLKEGKSINSLDDIGHGCPIEAIQVFTFVCQFQFKESFSKLGKFKKLGALAQSLQMSQQE